MYLNEVEFGLRIRKLRHLKGITQEKLAEELSITLSHMGKLENGDRKPSIDIVIQVAKHFGVSLDYLVFGYEHKVETAEEMALTLAAALEAFAARKMRG